MLITLFALTLALATDDPCARPEVVTKLDQPLPANGQVPFHTLNMWPEPEPILLDADGLEVPSSIVDHGSYDALVPEVLLPDGPYTVSFGDGEDQSLRVEGDEDLQPPPPPVFDSALREAYRSGDVMYVTFRALEEDQHLIELEVSATGRFDDDGYQTHLFGRKVTLGAQSCGSTFPPGFDHDQLYVLRARAVDRAGNASDWTRLAVGAGDRVGCSSTGASVSGLLGLMGLLGVRRRVGRLAISRPGRHASQT